MISLAALPVQSEEYAVAPAGRLIVFSLTAQRLSQHAGPQQAAPGWLPGKPARSSDQSYARKER